MIVAGNRLSQEDQFDASAPIRGLNYVVGSVWHDESNRGVRLRRLFMTGGWQNWPEFVPDSQG